MVFIFIQAAVLKFDTSILFPNSTTLLIYPYFFLNIETQGGMGICGEHGGEPSSVEFVNSIGLDYVSCSPFRVPIARLVAAQV